MSVAEDGSEDKGSDPWQRGQDGGIGCLIRSGRVLILLEPSFEVLIGVPALSPNEQ